MFKQISSVSRGKFVSYSRRKEIAPHGTVSRYIGIDEAYIKIMEKGAKSVFGITIKGRASLKLIRDAFTDICKMEGIR